MVFHWINDRLVAIADKNLFSTDNPKYQEFRQKLIDEKGIWYDNHAVFVTGNATKFSFTITEQNLLTFHSNHLPFSQTDFNNLITFLSGEPLPPKRNILKPFLTNNIKPS